MCVCVCVCVCVVSMTNGNGLAALFIVTMVTPFKAGVGGNDFTTCIGKPDSDDLADIGRNPSKAMRQNVAQVVEAWNVVVGYKIEPS